MLRSTPCGRCGLAVRQLALGDAVGPVREILERRAAELPASGFEHELAGLSGLRRGESRLPPTELNAPKRCGNGARRQLPELMAADAAVVLHRVEPVGLRDLRRNVALAAELARLGDLQHRVPVDRRIVLRRCRLIRRRHGLEVQSLPGSLVTFGESTRP